MISFKELSMQPQNFSRLSGVKIEKFQKIVDLIRPDWEKIQKKKNRIGRRSHLPDLETEVLLVYYRFYTSFLFLGAIFNIDASNVCRHLQRLEPLIARRIHIEKKRDFTENDLVEIIDATEIQIQRPSKVQKKFYSGKKKKHTMKTDGKILDERFLAYLQATPRHCFISKNTFSTKCRDLYNSRLSSFMEK